MNDQEIRNLCAWLGLNQECTLEDCREQILKRSETVKELRNRIKVLEREELFYINVVKRLLNMSEDESCEEVPRKIRTLIDERAQALASAEALRKEQIPVYLKESMERWAMQQPFHAFLVKERQEMLKKIERTKRDIAREFAEGFLSAFQEEDCDDNDRSNY